MSVLGRVLLVFASLFPVLCLGQIRPAPETPPVRLVPKAVAWARIVGHTDRGLKLEVGPWQPYDASQVHVARQTENAFDQLEYVFDVSGDIVPSQNPNYGDSCVPPLPDGAQRYFFGDAFEVGNYYNDIKCVPASAGTTSTRCGFAWYDNKGVAFLNMAVFVATTENWVTDASHVNDPTATGRGDNTGVIVSFGPDTGTGAPYYSDVDVEGTGLGWTIPASGHGGIVCAAGDYDSFNHVMTLGKSQMMLWGRKPNNPAAAEDPFCWIDGFPFNATLGESDFMSLDYSGTGVCPTACVLGPTVCLFTSGTGSQVLRPTVTTILLGAVVSGDNASLAADDGNPLKVCKAFVPNQTSPRIRTESDFVSPFLTPSSIELKLKARMTTGGNFKVRAFLADRTGGQYTYGLPNQVLSDSTLGLGFTEFTANPTGQISRFVASDGSMRVRLEIQQTGFSAVAVPCAEFEVLNLTVGP